MRLGGFVIHGNNAQTLGGALDALTACCDETLAVDSGSTDGSAALVAAKGIRAINLPWQGFGAARAEAARALAHCDYLFFLDSDETLSAKSIEAVRAWKASDPRCAYYRLIRNDWAELPSGRFLFRREHRKRLIRIDFARWSADMIVHEALTDPGDTQDLPAEIDHRFAISIEDRSERDDFYALLWAVKEFGRGGRIRSGRGRRGWHWFRNAVLKGAAFRGGAAGSRLAWSVAGVHARKYGYLNEVAQGRYPTLLEAWKQGDFARLNALARAATTTGGLLPKATPTPEQR